MTRASADSSGAMWADGVGDGVATSRASVSLREVGTSSHDPASLPLRMRRMRTPSESTTSPASINARSRIDPSSDRCNAIPRSLYLGGFFEAFTRGEAVHLGCDRREERMRVGQNGIESDAERCPLIQGARTRRPFPRTDNSCTGRGRYTDEEADAVRSASMRVVTMRREA